MVKLKYVLVSLILLYACSSSMKSTKAKVDNSVKLSTVFSDSTVTYGDTVRLLLRFKNTSDNIKSFYPVAPIFLVGRRATIGLVTSDFVSIKWRDTYTITYTIVVTRESFNQGENLLFVNYYLSKDLQQSLAPFDVQLLRSNEVRLFVR